MKNERSNADVIIIANHHEPKEILPSYFDIEQISKLVREDENKGKAMWDLMFKAIHKNNKAQVEKEFPARKHPF